MANSVLGKKKSRAEHHLAIGVYMINRILHAPLWIRILSSSVQHKIRIHAGACNILSLHGARKGSLDQLKVSCFTELSVS